MRCTYSPQQAHWHSLWAETNAERVDETQATKAFAQLRINDVLSCLYGLPGARSIDFITLPPIVTGLSFLATWHHTTNGESYQTKKDQVLQQPVETTHSQNNASI